jgi:glycosyltransferase involved in cell wall biosynthesis
MHIVHIVDYYQPQIGYQEHLLALEHQRMGHRVTVVTSDRYFPHSHYDQVYAPVLGPRIVGPGTRSEEGVTVIRLRTLLDVGGFVICPGIPSCLRVLAPDFVVHHGLLHPNFWMTGCAAIRAGWPLVVDSHMAHYNTLTSGLLRRSYLAAYRLLLQRFVCKRARVVAIGPCEQEFLQKVIPRVTTTIVPLSADSALFSPPDPATRMALRGDLGFQPEDVVLIHAGKFLPGKHTLELVRAFNTLKSELPRLHLLLIGGGDPEIEAAIDREINGEARIRHIPFFPREKLPRFLAAADIGVWPGPAPSIVFIEAMAMGLPLVLHDDTYGNHIVRADNGIVVACEEGLSSAIRSLATNPVLRHTLSANARRLFLDEFQGSATARRFLELPNPVG